MSTTFLLVAGDVAPDVRTGRPKLISGRDKLSQDLQGVMATHARPDNIGAGLEEVADGRPTDEFEVRGEVSTRVERALNTMARLQDRWNRASRGLDERIRGVRSVVVQPVGSPSTDYLLRIEVASVDGGRTAIAGRLRT